jgi:inner membrane protein
MDPLCHSLTGLAMGRAGLDRRSPLALTTLVLGANAPDIDIAAFVAADVWMDVRRGWTHGPVAMVVLPLAITGLVLAVDRGIRRRSPAAPPADPAQTLWLAALSTWSHPLLDYMNSFGIRLLMPFSGTWYYGDALYIYDPWMWLLLAAGLAASWRWRARPGASRRAAAAGLAAALGFAALMYGSNLWARAEVHAGLARAGRPDARFMVTPVAVNPFRRDVLIDIGTRYEQGVVTFAPAPRFRPAGYGIDRNDRDPAAEAAAATPIGRKYLGWSRFPFFVVERSGPRPVVVVNDARYSGPSGRDGWAGVVIEIPPTPAAR